MPKPQSYANGMVAFAKVQNNLESSSLLGEKNKIIVELFGKKEKNVTEGSGHFVTVTDCPDTNVTNNKFLLVLI
jgi:hypothetical protein